MPTAKGIQVISTDERPDALLVLWRECFLRIMERDGYLVIGSRNGYKVGDTAAERYDMGVDFRVVGDATYEDAQRQLRIIEEVSGVGLPEPPAWQRFYKAVVAE